MSEVHQLVKGEAGFVDYTQPAVAEPPRPITPPSTREQDQLILNSIATVVESLLKELKRKPSSERTVEIERLLRAKVPALLSQVVATRRLKTGVSRAFSDSFETVKAGRRLLVGITCSTPEELPRLVQQALELFKTECQSEPA